MYCKQTLSSSIGLLSDIINPVELREICYTVSGKKSLANIATSLRGDDVQFDVIKNTV